MLCALSLVQHILPFLLVGALFCSPGTLAAMCAGTRLLVPSLVGIVLQQPPLAVLLQQAVIAAITANPWGYCRTPLLADPLTQLRLTRIWLALDAALPVPFAIAPATHGSVDDPSGE